MKDVIVNFPSLHVLLAPLGTLDLSIQAVVLQMSVDITERD